MFCSLRHTRGAFEVTHLLRITQKLQIPPFISPQKLSLYVYWRLRLPPLIRVYSTVVVPASPVSFIDSLFSVSARAVSVMLSNIRQTRRVCVRLNRVLPKGTDTKVLDQSMACIRPRCLMSPPVRSGKICHLDTLFLKACDCGVQIISQHVTG